MQTFKYKVILGIFKGFEFNGYEEKGMIINADAPETSFRKSDVVNPHTPYPTTPFQKESDETTKACRKISDNANTLAEKEANKKK